MPAFSRLVRFLGKDGRTYNGEPILPQGVSDIAKAQQAKVITGDIFGQSQVTDNVVDIRLLLAPLAPENVGTVRCLGWNYADHAKESNEDLPKYPVLFYKPRTALSGPTDPIVVSAMAQEVPGVDYECELVAVIGKQCKDVSEADALSYVLGYTVGDDVSHREWQLKRGGGQWSHGKGQDTWAPMGPGIVTTDLIKDPQDLKLKTKLNGKVVQDYTSKNMIFNLRQTISFLSRGTTLMPGDLIWTGTPPGVILGQKNPVWLKDGDVVEVSIEGIGTCINKIEFSNKEDKSFKAKF